MQMSNLIRPNLQEPQRQQNISTPPINTPLSNRGVTRIEDPTVFLEPPYRPTLSQLSTINNQLYSFPNVTETFISTSNELLEPPRNKSSGLHTIKVEEIAPSMKPRPSLNTLEAQENIDEVQIKKTPISLGKCERVSRLSSTHFKSYLKESIVNKSDTLISKTEQYKTVKKSSPSDFDHSKEELTEKGKTSKDHKDLFNFLISRGPVRTQPREAEAITPSHKRSKSVDYQLNCIKEFILFPEGRAIDNVPPSVLSNSKIFEPSEKPSPLLFYIMNQKDSAIDPFIKASAVQKKVDEIYQESIKNIDLKEVREILDSYDYLKDKCTKIQIICEGSSAIGYKGPEKLLENGQRVPFDSSPEVGLFEKRKSDEPESPENGGHLTDGNGYYKYGKKKEGFDLDFAIVITMNDLPKGQPKGNMEKILDTINDLFIPFFEKLLADSSLKTSKMDDPEMVNFINNKTDPFKTPINRIYLEEADQNKTRKGSPIKRYQKKEGFDFIDDNSKNSWETFKEGVPEESRSAINWGSIETGRYHLGTPF